jgi:NADPH-dependent glutamate synthase beta subunit-like oxidoreductase
MPKAPEQKNGKKIALIGGGPASLTVARDLAPLGYEIHLYDEWHKGGGMMRTQIPAFRLPEEVLDEEVNYVINMGIHTHFNTFVSSMKEILDQDYDAVFVGTGAPKGRSLNLPGAEEASKNIHIGIEFLADVAFEHREKIGKKVIVLGGGNTAMDCCRTSRRLGGDDVKVVVRSPFKDMKASPWEIEDAMREDIPIMNNMPPKKFVVENGKLKGVIFGKVRAEYSETGRRKLIPTGEPDVFIEADDVIIAIGQDNAFPWIERDLGIEFGKWDLPVLDKMTFQSTLPKVFFGGDAAFGPENIITAAAHGHQAAISIHLFLEGKDLIDDRPNPLTNLVSQKMGIHEWMYDSPIANDERYAVPHEEKTISLTNRKIEVELGFSQETGFKEAMRCLNCDVQTVFDTTSCIECDACMDVCPTSCITFTDNGEEDDLRGRLLAPALNLEQDLYVSDTLATGKVMIKDEDVCLHCGLCAERCPTAAWDMKKYLYEVTKTYQMS